MARNFRRHRGAQPIADLNVTNLIDLGFMLLIIFMVVTPLINQDQSIQVNLPTESKRAQPKADDALTYQVISINQTGQYYWGGRPVDFTELPALLETEAQKPKPAVIRIRANWNLQYQKVISLVDEIKKHNLTKISFDTQTAN
ncbi:MAG: ExbD/TolR family protein [Opitutales bacterium]